MIIYNERLIKFQGYREGAFYILRPADIEEFRNVSFENLDNAFAFRKSSKDMFLYEKRLRNNNYIILRKVDFFNLKKESEKMDYSTTLKKARELDFSRTIDFVRVNTIYFISPYIQERFMQTDDITLLEKDEIESEYINEYIKVTPFFKCFNTIKKYIIDGKLYVYAAVENNNIKHELVLDSETLLDLFKKYQHPDYEPFNIKEVFNELQPKVQEEKEEQKVEIDDKTKDFIHSIEITGTVSKSDDKEELLISELNKDIEINDNEELSDDDISEMDESDIDDL